MSNTQLRDALKIGAEVVKQRIKNKTYNYWTIADLNTLKKKSQEYWKAHQSEMSFEAYAEFEGAVIDYHRGVASLAQWDGAAEFDKLDRSVINNNKLNDQSAVGLSIGRIKEAEDRWNAVWGLSKQAVGLVVFGGLGTTVGSGPKAPYSSGTQQAIVNASNKLSPYELTPTHGPTLSKTKMIELKADIQAHGIKESIKYVEYNGVKYVVNGHHRLRIAKELGIKSVPTQKVALPYAGYKTTSDLQYSRY